MGTKEDDQATLYFTESGVNFLESFIFSAELETKEDLRVIGENLLDKEIVTTMSYSEAGELRFKPKRDELLEELRKMDELIFPSWMLKKDEFIRLRLNGFKIKGIFKEEVDINVFADAILTKWGIGISCVSMWLGQDRDMDYIINFARLVLDHISLEVEIEHGEKGDRLKETLYNVIEKLREKLKRGISEQLDEESKIEVDKIYHTCVECQSLSKKHHPDFDGAPLDVIKKFPKQIYGLMKLTNEWIGRGPWRIERTLSHYWQSGNCQTLLYNDISMLRLDFFLQDALAKKEAEKVAKAKRKLGIDIEESWIKHKFVKREIPCIRNIVLVELFLFNKTLLYHIDAQLTRFMTPSLGKLSIIRREIANTLEIQSAIKTPLPELKETIEIMEEVSRVKDLKEEIFEKLEHLEDSIQTGHLLQQEKYTMFLSAAALAMSIILVISQLLFPALFPGIDQTVINFIMVLLILITILSSWALIRKWYQRHSK